MSVTSLPPPRPVLWPLRPQESARVSRSDSGGRRVVVIEHAPLAGVTAEMLRWWYGHVPGTMQYAGGTYPRYLVWHPLDHISYEVENPGGATTPVRAGTKLHIMEAFGRDLNSVLAIHVTVEAMDDHSATIGRRVLGSSLVRHCCWSFDAASSPPATDATTPGTTGAAALSRNATGPNRASAENSK